MVQILIRIARAVLKMVLQQLMQQFNILQEQVMSPMRQMVQQVTDGVWIGEGANAFVDEVSSIMIPGVGRVADDVDFFRNGLQKAEEIMDQLFEKNLRIDHVVCPSGSAGTHAGLVTGFYGCQTNIPVIGINVSRKKDVQEELVYSLVQETAAHVGIESEIPRSVVVCFDEYVGPGYSLPTAEMVEAVKMLAQYEGILMDPVYTGKAMAGFIDLIRKGYFEKDEKLLFVHTGGSPGLYAYVNDILG